MLNKLKSSLFVILLVGVVVKASLFPSFVDVAAVLGLLSFIGFEKHLAFKREQISHKEMIEKYDAKFEEYKRSLESYRVETSELRNEVKKLMTDSSLSSLQKRR